MSPYRLLALIAAVLAAAALFVFARAETGNSLVFTGVLVIVSAQAVWAIVYALRPSRGTLDVGMMIAAGVITLWAMLVLLPTSPVAASGAQARALDWRTLAAVGAEAAALILLLLERRRAYAAANSPWTPIGAALLAVVGLTIVASGAAQVFSPIEPQRAAEPDTTLALADPGTAGAPASAFPLPSGFPPMRVPEENPLTPERIELGRHLFYDARLSANGTQSCGSCHIQALAFSDGKTLPTGSTGEVLLRNSPSLANAGYNATLTWANPALTTIEQQALVPIFAEFPVELGATGHEEEILARLQEDDAYRRLFSQAFASDENPITWRNAVLATSAFVRSLVSGDSAYDRYITGDTHTLSEEARRGMESFFSERFECHHCHSGFNFSTSTVHANSTFPAANFQNNGLYNVDGAGAYPMGNRGLYEVTAKPGDMGRFRAPSLRNVELTAPYMHDGSIATLEEVIQHYADGGRMIESGPNAGDGRASPYKSPLVPGFNVSAQEKADLVAFLKSLTDDSFITNPAYADPFATETP